MNKNYFTYQIVPIEQTTELLNIEPKLGEFIDFTKPFNIRIMPDHFQCLIHCIISQQISSAALDTIWHKLIMYFKKITPKTIARATNEQLNAIGIASQKISPIKQIAYDIVDKKLNLDKLEKLSDAEITAILTKYKYVGQWTVNMMLMFTYYRPNIMPLSDLGVIKGLKILYNKTTISDKFADEIIKKFSNRLTLLTFCLWRIALNPIKSK